MTEAEVEIVVQRAREQFPQASPRIISDNGPQFIARDFKEFIRLCVMTHVWTSPFYPQSNGKIERWHQSLKGECIHPGVPLSIEDPRRLVGRYVDHYNRVRLHSAIGYVTPLAKLQGREPQIFAERESQAGSGAAAAPASPSGGSGPVVVTAQFELLTLEMLRTRITAPKLPWAAKNCARSILAWLRCMLISA